jgi:hypothetical protein
MRMVSDALQPGCGRPLARSVVAQLPTSATSITSFLLVVFVSEFPRSKLCTVAGIGGDSPASGDLAVVCSWSGGPCPPYVCGKSPKEIAFAVPMWGRGNGRTVCPQAPEPAIFPALREGQRPLAGDRAGDAGI